MKKYLTLTLCSKKIFTLSSCVSEIVTKVDETFYTQKFSNSCVVESCVTANKCFHKCFNSFFFFKGSRNESVVKTLVSKHIKYGSCQRLASLLCADTARLPFNVGASAPN